MMICFSIFHFTDLLITISGDHSTGYLYTQILCRIVNTLLMLYFTQHELKQLFSGESVSDYFSTFWNINDLSLAILYFIYLPVTYFREDG